MDVDPVVVRALGVPALQALRATDLVCVVDGAETVRQLTPDLRVLGGLPVPGVVVTSTGEGTRFDFVSRYFGAQEGGAEDPVAGSAHAQLAPLWARRLGRTSLTAGQLSARGGTLRCRVAGDRVLLSGRCHRYLDGWASIPSSPTGPSNARPVSETAGAADQSRPVHSLQVTPSQPHGRVET